MHIPDRVEVHQPADHGHHHQHDHGHIVDQQTDRDPGRPQVQPGPAFKRNSEIGVVSGKCLDEKPERKQKGDGDGGKRHPVSPARQAPPQESLDGVGKQRKCGNQQKIYGHIPPKTTPPSTTALNAAPEASTAQRVHPVYDDHLVVPVNIQHNR